MRSQNAPFSGPPAHVGKFCRLAHEVLTERNVLVQSNGRLKTMMKRFALLLWGYWAFMGQDGMAAKTGADSKAAQDILSSWSDSFVKTSRVQDVTTPDDGLYNSWSDTPVNEPEGETTVSVPPPFHVFATPPPDGMKLVPAGPFGMGTFFSLSYEMPVHTVTVSAFYIDTREVSGALWNRVRDWAVLHGYTDLPKGQSGYSRTGGAADSNHPIVQVSWFDCVKWCNARTEREGLSPVYYTDAMQLNVYRAGIPTNELIMSRMLNGYRLPTEAEWEKAARGGVARCNFPWGNTIDGGKANYQGNGDAFDDGTTPVGYFDGNQMIHGQRCADNMQNGYGLFDMAGNVYEWCWDWFGELGGEIPGNPEGAATGKYRVLRGGCWSSAMTDCLLCSFRHYMTPSTASSTIGFRSVRSL